MQCVWHSPLLWNSTTRKASTFTPKSILPMKYSIICFILILKRRDTISGRFCADCSFLSSRLISWQFRLHVIVTENRGSQHFSTWIRCSVTFAVCNCWYRCTLNAISSCFLTLLSLHYIQSLLNLQELLPMGLIFCTKFVSLIISDEIQVICFAHEILICKIPLEKLVEYNNVLDSTYL